MADQQQGDGGEDECVNAFKSGNKHMAEQLLPHTRPAVVRTTFELGVGRRVAMVSMVSLLHLAAYWGWTDISAVLVTVYGCAANWRDDRGHVPLHYAASNGQLDMMKYLLVDSTLRPNGQGRV